MKITSFLSLAAAMLAPICSAAEADPFTKLADSLVKKMPVASKPINIGVGNFVYSNTPMMSPLSTVIREELEIALPKSNKVKVITGSNLDQLEMEGEFQATDLVEPGTTIDKVTVEGVEGIVRGRFVTDGRMVTLYTEIAWLKGGNITKDKISWPINAVAGRVWPDKTAGEATEMIQPQNAEQSMIQILHLLHKQSLQLKVP